MTKSFKIYIITKTQSAFPCTTSPCELQEKVWLEIQGRKRDKNHPKVAFLCSAAEHESFGLPLCSFHGHSRYSPTEENLIHRNTANTSILTKLDTY